MNIRYNLCKYGRANGAFSLIELLIVIVIVAILVSISIPSLHYLLQRYHFMMLCDRLKNSLYYTKSMAVLKSQTLMICGSEDGKRCNGNWQHYWLIQDVAHQHVLRRIQLPDVQPFSLQWQGNFKARNGIYFNALGETGGQQGRFYMTLGVNHLEIALTLSGRMRIMNT